MLYIQCWKCCCGANEILPFDIDNSTLQTIALCTFWQLCISFNPIQIYYQYIQCHYLYWFIILQCHHCNHMKKYLLFHMRTFLRQKGCRHAGFSVISSISGSHKLHVLLQCSAIQESQRPGASFGYLEGGQNGHFHSLHPVSKGCNLLKKRH